MRVLVCGGRHFLDVRWLWGALDLLHDRSPITEIIEGGAGGADIRAKWWADRERILCTEVRADWDKHGKSAGYKRNVEMADLRPDIVLATPGGKGTAHMVTIAKDRGLRVIYLEKMPVPRPTGPMVVSAPGATSYPGIA